MNAVKSPFTVPKQILHAQYTSVFSVNGFQTGTDVHSDGTVIFSNLVYIDTASKQHLVDWIRLLLNLLN